MVNSFGLLSINVQLVSLNTAILNVVTVTALSFTAFFISNVLFSIVISKWWTTVKCIYFIIGLKYMLNVSVLITKFCSFEDVVILNWWSFQLLVSHDINEHVCMAFLLTHSFLMWICKSDKICHFLSLNIYTNLVLILCILFYFQSFANLNYR